MPIEETLARIEQDLADGRLALARQRLRGLMGSFPDRLDLRERLADVYRREGDLAQAGRWSFLAEQPLEAELQAFERAYASDPFKLMRALAWNQPEDAAPTTTAAARLRALRERAEAEAGRPVLWSDPRRPASRWESLKETGCAILALVALAVVVVGLIEAFVDGLDTITGLLE